MNKSVREEIEKEANEQFILTLDRNICIFGATFGYNLALKHCQVLREALGYMVMRMTDVKMESQWLDEARKALEQFDKIMGE